jgi:hypothetical protein
MGWGTGIRDTISGIRDLGSGIRDPKQTYPGSRGQKSNKSRIRIRNDAKFSQKSRSLVRIIGLNRQCYKNTYNLYSTKNPTNLLPAT